MNRIITIHDNCCGYHSYVRDWQGNIRCVVTPFGNSSSAMEQENYYYPYGLPMSCTTGAAGNPYKYGAKELDTRHGLNAYDFHARLHLPDIARFSRPDPQAHDYPGISPYAYCAANPVRFIDPTGEDIYWIDPYGHIVKQITDKEEIFIPVSDMSSQYINPDDTDNKLVLPEGSISQVRKNEYFEFKKDEYAVTMFFVNGDDNAKALFEFLAQFKKTTDVEWSRTRIGFKENQKNVVGTAHKENETIQAGFLVLSGYSINYDVHSHPKNSKANKNDTIVADGIKRKFPHAVFELYRNKSYELIK